MSLRPREEDDLQGMEVLGGLQLQDSSTVGNVMGSVIGICKYA